MKVSEIVFGVGFCVRVLCVRPCSEASSTGASVYCVIVCESRMRFDFADMCYVSF